MIFEQLSLIGFKSFANKTTIHFSKNTTAIIGPNGSGKSNILDAIKWVLGEQSIRSIRGEIMDDIIFAGTQNLPPLHHTEVSLKLNNRERLLKFDADQILISRKYSREHHSEFFLNDKKIPLKDIHSLFMDTGIGKSCYSFMEQGKVDVILSSKPENRRSIFEEAAGISSFKSRKEQAEKNLEKTHFNATRLKDILHELERELKIKSQQAQQTKNYMQINKELQRKSLQLKYYQLTQIEKMFDNEQKNLYQEEQELEKKRQKFIHVEEQIEILGKEQQTIQGTLNQAKIDNQIKEAEIIQYNLRIADKRQRYTVIQNDKKILTDQLEVITKQIQNTQVKLNLHKQYTLDISEQIHQSKQTQITIKIELKALKKNKEKLRKQTEEIKVEGNQLNSQLNNIRKEQKQVIQMLLDGLKKEVVLWQKYQEDKTTDTEQFIQEMNTSATNLSIQLRGIQGNVDLKSILEEIATRHGRLIDQWITKIYSIAKPYAGLHDLLLEDEGIYFQKASNDQSIRLMEETLERNIKEQHNIQHKLAKNESEYLDITRRFEHLINDIKTFSIKQEGLQGHTEQLENTFKEQRSQIELHNTLLNKVVTEGIQINQDNQEYNQDIKQSQKYIQRSNQNILTMKKQYEHLQTKKQNLSDQCNSIKRNLDMKIAKIANLRITIEKHTTSIDYLVQEIYNSYEMTREQLHKKFHRQSTQVDQMQTDITSLQLQLKRLGIVNPLAIQELEDIENLYKHNDSQLKDVLEAKSKIMQILDDIQKQSEQIFLNIFSEIQTHFSHVFKKLFDGGSTQLTLQDPTKPLESGIDIQVQPYGKKLKSIRLLSGGEKAMTAIALMFAIYMTRSSPICVLDEIDAPLDDQNVGRFFHLLDSFKEKTQFILITHNKKTMSKVNNLFGVTMEEIGVSKVFSIKLPKEQLT